jgi:hypothetical protein
MKRPYAYCKLDGVLYRYVPPPLDIVDTWTTHVQAAPFTQGAWGELVPLEYEAAIKHAIPSTDAAMIVAGM